MVFSSVIFLLYFLPIFLILYFLSPEKWKNGLALLGSCFFYIWGAPEFFFIVVLSIILDFYLVKLFSLSRGKLRKWLMALAVFLNVGILLVAKYLNFFVANLNAVLESIGIDGVAWTAIILPIGISFITFQKLSYVIDCYQQKVKPLDRLSDYALYILLFPQLIAGPIVRYNEVAAQLTDRKENQNINNKVSGLLRFLVGLAKKVLIANTLGEVVDEVFLMDPEGMSSSIAWLGIIAYSFQIYFDFSGYSDMAIGIALMMGFKFPENFNYPYISGSITEFWRRWHMTLGNWMRDYLYIPLGGNRVSSRRMYINLWIVFLISGFWHGAAWTFVFWGAWHGLFLVLDRLFLKDKLKQVGPVPAMLFTYLIVLIGWVFFRSENLSYAAHYLGKMFAFDFSSPGIYLNSQFWFFLFIGMICSFSGIIKQIEKHAISFYQVGAQFRYTFLKATVCLFLTWICMTSIFSSAFNPFIYFKF